MQGWCKVSAKSSFSVVVVSFSFVSAAWENGLRYLSEKKVRLLLLLDMER